MPAASPALERFWAKVNKTDGCWLWTAAADNNDGIARFAPTRGHPTTARRFSWILHFGEPAPGARIVQSCGNKRCVCPDHLAIEVSRNRSPPTQIRFWSRVLKTENCWEWSGALKSNGYGTLSVRGRPTYAHRVSWEIHVGAIPDTLCVLHRCDNPKCVRPDHLFLGTIADNNRDALTKGRHVSGFTVSPRDKRGHCVRKEQACG